MVPGSLGWGSAVFAAMATLAPSAAARSAIALPMPRLPPVMNRVLPLRSAMGLLRPFLKTLKRRRSRRHQLVDLRRFLVGDLDVQGAEAVLELLHGTGTDDDGGHGGVPERPRIGEAGKRDPLCLGHWQELLDDVEAALELGVCDVADPGLGARAVLRIAGLAPVLAAEPSALEGAPDDVGDAELLRHRKVLELHHPAQDAVGRLQGDEPLPAAPVADPQRLHDLPGGEALLP